MKRKRKSTSCATQIGNKDDHIQEMGPFITDLPKSIIHMVLLKIPTRSILVCKCVCKTWHGLISDPEFAQLHFAQAEVFPMVRPLGPARVSRTLYFVEPEDSSGSFLKDSGAYDRYRKRSDFHMILSKCKIPLRNVEQVISNHGNANVMLDRKHGTTRKPCIKISPRTNEYKVIRMFKQGTPRPNRVAEIHTLGAGSWKSVGSAPSLASKLAFTTYVKGVLYRFCDEWSSFTIISFDLDTEKLQSVPSPPFGREKCRNVVLGVLGDCICVCHTDDLKIKFWTLNDSGAQKLWRKNISINTQDAGRWPYGSFKPMKYLQNVCLLMFNSHTNAFFYFHPRNHSPFIFLKLRGFKSDFEVFSHVPSFISLKDILVGKDVEVLNINSRCAGLKLLGETKALFLEEDIAELGSDFYSTDSCEDYED
ncbi:PREDICTED: F-box [Prunus dulcis]|uniref:PREDICTED: F-box n=1 Tax=Prunus dulcis TaxID=3755 RepID=A0A5E4GEI9_PRUDU|nr:PREDICTED: F-box [Prunus dulcis]